MDEGPIKRYSLSFKNEAEKLMKPPALVLNQELVARYLSSFEEGFKEEIMALVRQEIVRDAKDAAAKPPVAPVVGAAPVKAARKGETIELAKLITLVGLLTENFAGGFGFRSDSHLATVAQVDHIPASERYSLASEKLRAKGLVKGEDSERYEGFMNDIAQLKDANKIQTKGLEALGNEIKGIETRVVSSVNGALNSFKQSFTNDIKHSLNLHSQGDAPAQDSGTPNDLNNQQVYDTAGDELRTFRVQKYIKERLESAQPAFLQTFNQNSQPVNYPSQVQMGYFPPPQAQPQYQALAQPVSPPATAPLAINVGSNTIDLQMLAQLMEPFQKMTGNSSGNDQAGKLVGPMKEGKARRNPKLPSARPPKGSRKVDKAVHWRTEATRGSSAEINEEDNNEEDPAQSDDDNDNDDDEDDDKSEEREFEPIVEVSPAGKQANPRKLDDRELEQGSDDPELPFGDVPEVNRGEQLSTSRKKKKTQSVNSKEKAYELVAPIEERSRNGGDLMDCLLDNEIPVKMGDLIHASPSLARKLKSEITKRRLPLETTRVMFQNTEDNPRGLLVV
ncbi:hypothetical protein C8J57DRAFT_1227253 [Mycena rebaudengoi]|nr:hypothetical protein C8J57DRAFT_1227253 [Mycena rebaudengoi]